jgi:hypothetical protein
VLSQSCACTGKPSRTITSSEPSRWTGEHSKSARGTRQPMGRRSVICGRGALLDGQRIESVEVIPYEHEYTYDILSGSDTGTYFAAGMEIGSTLVRSAAGTLGGRLPR